MHTDGVGLLGTLDLGDVGGWEGSACRRGPEEARGGAPSSQGGRWEGGADGSGTPLLVVPHSHWLVWFPGADGKEEEGGSRVRRQGVGPRGALEEGRVNGALEEGRVNGALGSP